jgi:hypothetical protein
MNAKHSAVAGKCHKNSKENDKIRPKVSVLTLIGVLPGLAGGKGGGG